jgi:hypothetical protein
MAILLCSIVNGIPADPEGGIVHIPERGMTAVGLTVDDPSSLSSEETKQALNNRYRAINASYFSERTLIPLRFGMVVDDQAEARQFLRNAALHLDALMDRLQGKCEVVIQVAVDVQAAVAELAPRVDMSDKVAAGKAFFELAQEQREVISKALSAGLVAHVVEHREAGVPDGLTLLINTYLVEKAGIESFAAALGRVAEQCADFIVFNYSGPFPPYGFSAIEINKGNFELINEARNLLGLGERCTRDDLVARYRKLSFERHPDRHGGDDKEMQRLNNAYRIVTAYCKSREGEEIAFTREAVESSFMRV